MTPLSAAAARSALALEPSGLQRVSLNLKYTGGLQFVSDTLYQAIQAAFGTAKVRDPQPSRRAYRLLFDRESNYAANSGAEVDATTGVQQNAATGTLTRDTGTKLFGAASFKQVNPGTNANEGFGTPQINLPQVAPFNVKAHRVSAWVLGNAGGEALRLEIDESNAAGGFIGNAITDFAGTTSWQRVTAVRTFTSPGVKVAAKVVGQATAAATYFVDGFVIGPDDQHAGFDDNTLNPPITAEPIIVNVELAFDPAAPVPFNAALLYDALDTIGTVASDKDALGQGAYALTIAP